MKWTKCIICIRVVCDTAQANSAQFVFEFFHENIRKIAPKYVNLLCFYNMDIVLCHKKYRKMIPKYPIL